MHLKKTWPTRKNGTVSENQQKHRAETLELSNVGVENSYDFPVLKNHHQA